MKKSNIYWLGDENSLLSYLQTLSMEVDPKLLVGRRKENEQKPASSLLNYYGNVAVLSIQGSIYPKANWLTDWLGIPTYPGIRDALVEAAENPAVTDILLDIDSPGGSASGIDDISELMTKIDKPISAYTGGTMASAAYWIGAAADKVYASALASVGSIGVVATHFDLTKSLENDGVKATIFRAGEFKALGGPYEELTEKARTIIQTRMDTLYDAFVSHIASVRHASVKTVHDKMADGREFLGTEALKVGLIDGIMSIDDLMAKLQKNSTKSSQGRTNTRMEASEMKKKLLNQQAAAILEAGGNIDTALEAAEVESEDAQASEVETSVETSTEADTELTLESTVETTAEPNSDLVSYLKTELAAANEKATTLAMSARDLQAKLDAVNTTHAQFRDIVINAISVKQIALGGSSKTLDFSAFSDEALLQQHQQVAAEFSKTFPIGGKVQTPSTQQPASFTAGHQARLNAVKTSKS